MSVADESKGAEAWLAGKRALRLDANSELFPANRREFHMERYSFATQYCRGKRVLDGACGTGYGSAALGAVAKEVVGIDCEQDAVDYASRTYGKPNVSFQRAFVELTFFESSSFDAIVSFETVEHTLCPRAHMMEIARLLEPVDGIAILSVPNRWGYTRHHFFDFDFALLKQVTDPYFAQCRLFYHNPRTDMSMPAIGPLTSDAPHQAQCIIAVCSKPRKENVAADRMPVIMDEIYRSAFGRHEEYLSLAYKYNTGLVQRVLNKLRSLLP